jgi:hypothetical protein
MTKLYITVEKKAYRVLTENEVEPQVKLLTAFGKYLFGVVILLFLSVSRLANANPQNQNQNQNQSQSQSQFSPYLIQAPNLDPNSPGAQRIYQQQFDLQKEDRKDQKDRELKDDAKQSCDSAHEESRDLEDQIKKDCTNTGLGNCISEAAKCDEEDGDTDAGGGMGVMSQILGMAGSQYFGGGMMNNPMMGSLGGGSISCKMGTDEIKYWKRTQEDMYKDAKDSRKDAEDRLDDVQKEADDLTDAKSDAAKEYQEILKEMKDLNRGLPENIRKIKNEMAQRASEMRMKIGEAVQQQAKETQRRDLAQSALSRLYTKHMGACIDMNDNDKMEFTKELAQMQAQFDQDIAAIDDLRSRETKKNAYKSKFKTQQQMRAQMQKVKYNQCIKIAKENYTNEFSMLNATIVEANNNLATLKDAMEQAENMLGQLPNELNEAIEGAEGEAKDSRQAALETLNNLNNTLIQKTNNYNSRLSQAQNRLQKSEAEFMQKNMAYQSSQSVVAAGLGDVKPMLSQIRSAKCAEYFACKGVKGAKLRKKPSFCTGSEDDDSTPDAFEQYLDGAH